MKIFSLELKKNLALWGIILGLIVTSLLFISNKLLTPSPIECFGSNPVDCLVNPIPGRPDFGWPIQFHNYHGFIYDLISWILVSLIILSAIRYFKYKNFKF